jgi:hypothetical protein
MQRVWRIIGRVGGIGLVLTSIFFWLMPYQMRDGVATCLGIGVSVLCMVGVVLAARRYVATWPGFAMLVAGLVGAHLWLWRMWSLWESPVRLMRNLNTVAGLWIVDLLVAVVVDVVLILVLRDSAPGFMGAVWVLYPLALIGVARMAPDIETLLAPENLRTQVLWLTPLTLLPTLCCLSLPAFLVHLAIVLAKEIRKR